MSKRAILISSRASLVKSLVAPHFYRPIKKYSGHHHHGEEKEDLIDMERAQSTLEVMQKLSDDKEDIERTVEEKSHQGFVSHTSDKLKDAAQEAMGRDPNPEAVKQKYKEGASGETYHKPRDDGGVGPTSI